MTTFASTNSPPPPRSTPPAPRGSLWPPYLLAVVLLTLLALLLALIALWGEHERQREQARIASQNGTFSSKDRTPRDIASFNRPAIHQGNGYGTRR